MKTSIILKGKEVGYSIRRSRRARGISLTVYCQAGFVVTVPARIKTQSYIERYIYKNADWIIKQIDFYKNKTIYLGSPDYQSCKDKSMELVIQRLEYFNQFYGFVYNRVNVKNMKRIWGSCSSIKNLNYNYRLVFLPSSLIDYLIVHELCHLKEMNHSKRFWDLVSETIPDHKDRRKQLRMINF